MQETQESKIPKEKPTMGQRIGTLEKNLGAITGQVMMQLSQYDSNVQVMSRAIEQLDVRTMTYGRMLLELYGRLAQADKILSKMCAASISQKELEELRSLVKDDFESSFRAKAEEVLDERQKAILEQRKAAEEQQKQQQSAAEAQKAEQAMKESESPNLAAESGGRGAEIPKGAEVFGG